MNRYVLHVEVDAESRDDGVDKILQAFALTDLEAAILRPIFNALTEDQGEAR